jgi:hypothetical protein
VTWRPSLLWRDGILHTVGVIAVVGIAALAAQRLWRMRSAGTLHWRHSNTRWYFGTLVSAAVCLVLDATTVRTGAPVVTFGAALIAYLASNWMEQQARWLTATVTAVGYVASAVVCAALAHVQSSVPNGGYSSWWALFGLWTAVNLITLVCSYLPVLPRRPDARTRPAPPPLTPPTLTPLVS